MRFKTAYVLALAFFVGMGVGQGVATVAQQTFWGTGNKAPANFGSDGRTYLSIHPDGTIYSVNSGTFSGFTQASSTLTTPVINGVTTGTWDDLTAVTYAAGNYTASAGNWTVADADESITYQLIGSNLMILHVTLNTTTVSTTPQGLRMALPASKSCPGQDIWLGSFQANNNGTSATGVALCPSGAAYIEFRLETEGNWAAATDTTYIRGTFVVPVA